MPNEKDQAEQPLPPGEYTTQLDGVFDGIAAAPGGRDRVLRLSFKLLDGGGTRRINHVIRKQR